MILIVDNGSQYTHLIKRNCRELGREAEMIYAKADYTHVEEMLKTGVERIIISGGPKSVYEEAPNIGTKICEKVRDGEIRLPLLGICYGHQMIAHVFGGEVKKGKSAEYGVGEIDIDEEDTLFKGVPKKLKAWVSHYDQVVKLPEGFTSTAHSNVCAIEAMTHNERPIYGIQFHPEVWHTEHGEQILKNFIEAK